MRLDLDGAVALLHGSGLQAGISAARAPRIIGGLSASQAAGPTVYERCFSIEPHGPGWLVRAETGERHVDQFVSDSLDGAVRIVLSLRRR